MVEGDSASAHGSHALSLGRRHSSQPSAASIVLMIVELVRDRRPMGACSFAARCCGELRLGEAEQ